MYFRQRARIARQQAVAQTEPEQTNAKFDPFKPGTRQLKSGYKRIGGGVIEEVATGKQAVF